MKSSWLKPNNWLIPNQDPTHLGLAIESTVLDYCQHDMETIRSIFYDYIKKGDDKMTTNKTNHYCYPVIEKVIVNGPATIVYFDDNDRVIVKKMGVDKDDLFSAVAQAYCKKAFGSTSAFHREVLNKLVVQEPKKKNASVSPEINKQIDDGIRSVAEGIDSAFKQMIDNFKTNI